MTARPVNLLEGNPTEMVVNDKERDIILKIDADKPIICKLVRDMRSPNKQAYTPVTYYAYKIGPNDKDNRTMPSRKSLGLGPDLMNDAFFEAASNRKKAGKEYGENSDEYRRFDLITKRLKPKNGGYLYVVEPGSSKIKALKVSAQIINQIFGKEETSYSKAVPSVAEKMKKNNRSPYDLRIEDGWLEISKTGEYLTTEYIVKEAVTQVDKVIDGTMVTMSIPCKHKVHETIYNGQIDLNDIPDPLEFEKKAAFSEEETVEFIQNHVVPERFLRREKTGNGNSSENNTTTSGPRDALAALSALNVPSSEDPDSFM